MVSVKFAAEKGAKLRRTCRIVGALGMVFATIIAGSTVGAAQVAPLPPATDDGASAAPAVTSWDVNMYLQNSERTNLELALERASGAPIGDTITWIDSRTHASGTIKPLHDVASANGQTCRSYDVTVDIPQRFSTAWMSNAGTYNNYITRAVQEPLSPAFTRRFVAQTCRLSDGALVPAPGS